MSEQIGFIGLGLMGKPMVRNLLKRGYAVNIFNRSQPAINELASDGAIPASSPREVASRSSVVITMLPDAPEVEQVLLGPDGVFAGSQPGALVIDMSTISPRAAVTLATKAREHGLGLLDAPVSGGDVGAINATLSI